MKSKNITMKDIAEKAGVSITTVSHVLNKTRHVKRVTREAVLKIIEDSQYQGIKSKKVDKIEFIGVIIADIREDYYTSIIKSIESMASNMGISILFCDSEDDPEKENKNIQMMLSRRVSGLILAPIASENILNELNTADIPIVLIDRQYENHNFLFVGINNFNSSLLGAKHLFEKGSKRIAFIGYSESVYTVKQRIMGYKSYLLELDNKMQPMVLYLNYHEEDSYPIIKKFIEVNNIDGVICATSAICYELINVINDLDYKVQKNIKIISYDDNRWLDYLKFPVSVISQPTADIGYAALENLISVIEQPNTMNKIKRELTFDVKIIDRL